MAPPWKVDWAERIADFAARDGHASIWDYLVAHPTAALDRVAKQIPSSMALQIQQLAIAQCRARKCLDLLVRDLLVRELHRRLDDGWHDGAHEKAAMALLLMHEDMPEPYATLAKQLPTALRDEAPPRGWLPAAHDDAILMRAYARALATLSEEQRRLVADGGIQPRPGDVYWAKIQAVSDVFSFDERDLEARLAQLQPPIVDLLAAHRCQREVRSDGLYLLLINHEGLLLPEAVAGLRAIGMPESAAIMAEAMRLCGEPYPRNRQAILLAMRDRAGDVRPRLAALDRRLVKLLGWEAGGFAVAADAYAATIVGPPWLTH